MEGVVICKAWIARDDGADGDLCLFCNKPKKTTIGGLGCWIDMYHEPEYLDSKLFPRVKWEDEEPTEVEVVVRLIKTEVLPSKRARRSNK